MISARRQADGQCVASIGPKFNKNRCQAQVRSAPISWLCYVLLLILVVLAHQSQSSSLATSNGRDHQGAIIGASGTGVSKQVAGEIVAIKEGADLDLSCPIVVPDEDMIISWTCENEPASIRSSRIHVTDSGKLRILSAKVGDSCNYRCEAANGFGTLSVVIRVIIVERRLIDELTRRNNSSGATRGQNERTQARISSTKALVFSKPVVPTPKAHVVEEDQAHELMFRTTGQTSSDEAHIEIQIEPSTVSVRKNTTFSLECRIKYAPQIGVPQIIWLKQFIGPKPSSLAEALDQNLILLEDVYYHSLNWPRSVTYSDKSLSASSALLIRQANYVHSGRYVCLAGYPTALMSLRLNHANPGTMTSEVEPLSSINEHMKSPLKYKTARALVEVDDPEGKLNYQLSLENLAPDGKRPEHSNILMNVLASNSWMRNSTILLCLVLSGLMLFKLLQLKRPANKTAAQATRFDLNPTDIDSARLAGSQSVADQNLIGGNLCEPTLDRTKSNSIINSNNHNNTKLDENLLSQKLITLRERDLDLSTDHVYSEIGYMNDGKKVSAADEPHYKQPKTNLSGSIGEG